MLTGDRPCPDAACDNGGVCSVFNWTLTCDCVGDYSGGHCAQGSTMLEDGTVEILVIILCVAGVIIFLLVVTSVVACRSRRRADEQEPYSNIIADDDSAETPFPFAKKATAYNSKHFSNGGVH